jgi:adenylate kinase
MRHVVFVGPQGAGKGTQAALVASKFRLVHLSTGELLREVMASASPAGDEVRVYVDRGDLVPDDVMARMLFAALDERASASSSGALLDGFPRNAAQAEVLDEQIDARGEVLASVIHISVPRDVLMRRLTGRLTCRECGRTYHKEFNPPAVAGVCDFCGGELYTRSDDTEEAVGRRLAIYFEQTEPLLDRWRKRGLVHEIDGDQGIEQVAAAVEAALSQDFNGTGDR